MKDTEGAIGKSNHSQRDPNSKNLPTKKVIRKIESVLFFLNNNNEGSSLNVDLKDSSYILSFNCCSIKQKPILGVLDSNV